MLAPFMTTFGLDFDVVFGPAYMAFLFPSYHSQWESMSSMANRFSTAPTEKIKITALDAGML